jgi:hypothetical protein
MEKPSEQLKANPALDRLAEWQRHVAAPPLVIAILDQLWEEIERLKPEPVKPLGGVTGSPWDEPGDPIVK